MINPIKLALDLVNRFEVIRFIMVGSTAAAIHYGVYWLLFIAELPYNFAYASGFIISLTFNFFASNLFTFKTTPTFARAIKFCIGHGLNFITQFTIFNLANYINIDPRISPIVAFGLAFPINFLLIRFSLKGRIGQLRHNINKRIAKFIAYIK